MQADAAVIAAIEGKLTDFYAAMGGTKPEPPPEPVCLRRASADDVSAIAKLQEQIADLQHAVSGMQLRLIDNDTTIAQLKADVLMLAARTPRRAKHATVFAPDGSFDTVWMPRGKHQLSLELTLVGCIGALMRQADAAAFANLKNCHSEWITVTMTAQPEEAARVGLVILMAKDVGVAQLDHLLGKIGRHDARDYVRYPDGTRVVPKLATTSVKLNA